MSKTYYAIGDVHGMAPMLARLLSEIALDVIRNDVKDAQLVFLGDYVDRGLDSAGVLELVRDAVENSGAIAIIGNHEDMMIEALGKNNPSAFGMWMTNGGEATIASYPNRTYDEQLVSDVAWLETLPVYHEENDIIFVHGGIDPRSYPEMDRDTNLWTRSARFFASDEWGESLAGKLVVHGHTPALFGDLYLSRGQRINVDTGAVYGWKYPNDEKYAGGCLTAAKITPDRKVELIHIDQNLNASFSGDPRDRT